MGNPYHTLKGLFSRSWDRGHKKIENNTYAYRYKATWPHHDAPIDTIALVLHETAVFYACVDGTAAFEHEFSGSKTTRDRMRRYQRATHGSYFEAGKVRIGFTPVAELPHRGYSSGTYSCDGRAWLCTDLRSTYVLNVDYSSGNPPTTVRVWQPTGVDKGEWYAREFDTVRPSAAVTALCAEIDRVYGALSVVAECRPDVGDYHVMATNLADATNVFVKGFVTGQSQAARQRLIDKCIVRLVFRRRRGAGLTGKLATTVLAVATAKHAASGAVGSCASPLGEMFLRNVMTGEIVPMNLDDPSACKYWVHPQALEAFLDSYRSEDAAVRQAGEAGAEPELSRAGGRVQEVAECAC